MNKDLKYLVFGAVMAALMTACSGNGTLYGGMTSGNTQGMAGTYVLTDAYNETYVQFTVDSNNNVTGYAVDVYDDPVSVATSTRTFTGSVDAYGNLTVSGQGGLMTGTGMIAGNGSASLDLRNMTINNWVFNYQLNGFNANASANSSLVGTYYSKLAPTTYKSLMITLDTAARIRGVGIDQGGDTYDFEGYSSAQGDSIIGRVRSSQIRTPAFFHGSLYSGNSLTLSYTIDTRLNFLMRSPIQLPQSFLTSTLFAGIYTGTAGMGSITGSTTRFIINGDGDVRGLTAPSLFGNLRSDWWSGKLSFDYSRNQGNWYGNGYPITRGTISTNPTATVAGTLSPLTSNPSIYYFGGMIINLQTPATGTMYMVQETGAILARVDVVPAIVTLAVGSVEQFRAIALYTDGTTSDVTAAAVWSSGTPTVAGAEPTGGLVTALTPGIAIITATFGVHQGHAYCPVSTNGGPVLMYIRVMPPFPTVGIGGTQTFVATATYSDGSKVDVTTQALWSSGTPTVATNASNVATGVSAGTSNITASFMGMSDTRPLAVTGP